MKRARPLSSSCLAAWLQRFALPAERWRTALKREARERPFSDAGALARRVRAFLEEITEAERSPPAKRKRVGELLDARGWALLQAWQSGSHFPSFAEDLADYLESAGEAEAAPPVSKWLAALLHTDEAGRCGEQPMLLADAARVRRSERCLHAGEFDGFLRAVIKHREVSERVAASPEYRRDWRKLRRLFPKETRSRSLLHRSLVPERNWVKEGQGLRFATRAESFQTCLNLLCWKYCLWAVAPGGRPLVLKPSATITPWGTQLFIPAYLSLDFKRDIDVAHLSALHRARGVARQGEAFAEGRKLKAERQRRARRADKEAKRHGLRGEARLAYIAQATGLGPNWDERAVRRLIRGRR